MKIHRIDLSGNTEKYGEIEGHLYFNNVPNVDQALGALEHRYPDEDEAFVALHNSWKKALTQIFQDGLKVAEIKKFAESKLSHGAFYGEVPLGSHVTFIYQVEDVFEV